MVYKCQFCSTTKCAKKKGLACYVYPMSTASALAHIFCATFLCFCRFASLQYIQMCKKVGLACYVYPRTAASAPAHILGCYLFILFWQIDVSFEVRPNVQKKWGWLVMFTQTSAASAPAHIFGCYLFCVSAGKCQFCSTSKYAKKRGWLVMFTQGPQHQRQHIFGLFILFVNLVCASLQYV